MIELRANEIELQYELKHNTMKEEVLEEMRSDRERKMKASLKQKIEKRLITEMSREIRESLEGQIR